MDFLKNYPMHFAAADIEQKVFEAKQRSKQLFDVEHLKLALSLIDLTTLNSVDTQAKGAKFAENVNNFNANFPDLPNVAAICVYPSLVKTVATMLKCPGVGVASVAACFPASQSFIEVKELECRMAVEAGATDIDIVISQGAWLANDVQTVFDEIKAIRNAVGKAHLKVILETGVLRSPEDIWNASIVAMEAGADFIKTSTGKLEPAATPEAIYVMCEAIKAYAAKTGRKVGIKPAGGMTVSEDALLYMAIVEAVLGADWLNNRMFRLGASRMANNILSDIVSIESGKVQTVKYF